MLDLNRNSNEIHLPCFKMYIKPVKGVSMNVGVGKVINIEAFITATYGCL